MPESHHIVIVAQTFKDLRLFPDALDCALIGGIHDLKTVIAVLLYLKCDLFPACTVHGGDHEPEGPAA